MKNDSKSILKNYGIVKNKRREVQTPLHNLDSRGIQVSRNLIGHCRRPHKDVKTLQI